jgi:hypothetical protein
MGERLRRPRLGRRLRRVGRLERPRPRHPAHHAPGLQRLFHRHFIEGAWTPLADLHPDAIPAGVRAHRYDLGDVSVWAVVNRGQSAYRGPELRSGSSGYWFDAAGSSARVLDDTVSCEVPGRGISCLVWGFTTIPPGMGQPLRGVPVDSTFPAAARHSDSRTPVTGSGTRRAVRTSRTPAVINPRAGTGATAARRDGWRLRAIRVELGQQLLEPDSVEPG